MLVNYLKCHWKTISLFCGFCLIFAAVFALYDLEAEAVVYASLLSLALGLVFFVPSFMKYRKKLAALKESELSLQSSLGGLPPAQGEVEEEYQRLLGLLFSDMDRRRRESERERREAQDYYTLWAHQIKTPISAMHLLIGQEDDQRGRSLAAELFRVEQYVEMVLSYQRLDSESTDYLLRDCDLDELVRGCIRKYARLFVMKKLPFTFEETHLTVLTDEKWLSFVIEQLLSNALKYTSEGGIRVYAEGETLCIADTGIGIRAEDLPRVFDKGYTGYNGREFKKSTGIGLYLCRRVCDKLGHRLELRSEVGVGTCARIGLERDRTVYE